MCDALYASKLEPWSEFLTGKLGKAPEPLTTRWRSPSTRPTPAGWSCTPGSTRTAPVTRRRRRRAADDHLVKKRPDLAKQYGKHHWLNPTHPEVQEHSLAVILDVVKRYDVDGIHIDDYFYPYTEKDADGKDDPLPRRRHLGGVPEGRRQAGARRLAARRGQPLRRAAVQARSKAAKPWVKVGISPFGIWRPGHPPGIEGFDQYAELYADAKLWLNEGWVDYFTPQLYWPIEQEKQSYPKLLEWWAGENTKGRHLWPGNIPSR